jgi:hypothetical protein
MGQLMSLDNRTVEEMEEKAKAWANRHPGYIHEGAPVMNKPKKELVVKSAKKSTKVNKKSALPKNTVAHMAITPVLKNKLLIPPLLPVPVPRKVNGRWRPFGWAPPFTKPESISHYERGANAILDAIRTEWLEYFNNADTNLNLAGISDGFIKKLTNDMLK